MSRCFLALLALAIPVAPLAGQQSREAELALGRKYTTWFFGGQVDSLRAHMPESTRDGLTADQLRGRLNFVLENAGFEDSVLVEKIVLRNGQHQYWREARFTLIAEPIVLRWVILPSGEIGGIGLSPKSQAPPVEEIP